MTRRAVAYGLALVTAVVLLAFASFMPLQSRSGIIDTTRNQCPSLPATTKHYHLLLGQLHDYRLVRSHLVAPETSATDCGQPARLGLYL